MGCEVATGKTVKADTFPDPAYAMGKEAPFLVYENFTAIL